MSFIERTGQRWKVFIFFGLLLFGGVFLALMIWRVSDSESFPSVPGELPFAFSGTGAVLLAFVWLWLSVRCPRCAALVAGHILRNESAGHWLMKLMEFQDCPRCGFAGR
jgi:hypothetical protein